MDEENNVYNYDNSFFFTLLDSKRFQTKFKQIQDQQGLVVCPLDVTSSSRNPLNQQDLIDRHLFLPSPYLKNHYIPLICLSFSLNPVIYLILDDFKNILVFKNGQRTCENVKLLNIEHCYNDENKIYKILIINKELNFSDDKINSDFITNQELKKSREYSSLLDIDNLNVVSSFGQSIDFMHNTMCFVKTYDSIKRHCIGDDYLEKIELFKKTYILLETHLDDCCQNLKDLYEKYLRLFFKAYNLELKFRPSLAISSGHQIDLIILIACEIAIVGCMFSKLWTCVLKLNKNHDESLNEKFNFLRIKLCLDHFGKNKNKSIDLCKNFFQLNENFFEINFKNILKELNRIALLNNPIERLQCIRVTIDLLSNEMTILSLKHSEGEKMTNFVITSEVLIPLLSFILLLTNINCFKSIVYFIDKFNFSSQINESGLIEEISNHKSQSNTYLAELSYFMTTFKAAIQFIENSC
ncbi:unnamed protein product [Brachionus calyciflorus]|uniref:VPS9 domain-containing protein n=1 Tax=Brachionus calyciflorus TaxID=104777 RepID=A0A813M8D8_9BILA|nr:unnamed protein product [Brachionus calyciflorus]